jgi:5'(3')-deoxyribonucleotidase
MKIFLDMDGVLVDFVSGAHRAFNKHYDHAAPLVWEFFKEWGVSFKEFDAKCDIDFWDLLDWMPDGPEIEQTVRHKFGPENIYLLTTPMPNSGSGTGKLRWIKRCMPWVYDRTIISYAPKSLLAGPDTLLIDDKDENIAEFVAAGGCGILVPRPWNELHGWASETLQVIKNSLEAF